MHKQREKLFPAAQSLLLDHLLKENIVTYNPKAIADILHYTHINPEWN
ncbi:hypothetical protein ACX8XN_07615 [Calditrichota bacterium GD2]